MLGSDIALLRFQYDYPSNNNISVFKYLRNLIDKSKELQLQNFYMNCDCDDICPISQDIMISPVKLNCNHIFDKKNITFWLKNNATCPLCRKFIF
jgi:hypothetical protein